MSYLFWWTKLGFGPRILKPGLQIHQPGRFLMIPGIPPKWDLANPAFADPASPPYVFFLGKNAKQIGVRDGPAELKSSLPQLLTMVWEHAAVYFRPVTATFSYPVAKRTPGTGIQHIVGHRKGPMLHKHVSGLDTWCSHFSVKERSMLSQDRVEGGKRVAGVLGKSTRP